jgi:hypothetical protein
VRSCFFACVAPSRAAAALSDGARRVMNELAEAAASALELEVYGGDCVHDRDQVLSLIDLNDWPSYAPCRSGASEAIASYLTALTSAK